MGRAKENVGEEGKEDKFIWDHKVTQQWILDHQITGMWDHNQSKSLFKCLLLEIIW